MAYKMCNIRYVTAQLTICQAIEHLLSWDLETNIIIVDIPYRYDNPEIIDTIFYANSAIKTMVQSYQEKFNKFAFPGI